MEFWKEWEKELFWEVQDLQDHIKEIKEIEINQRYYQSKHDKMFGYPIVYKEMQEDFRIIERNSNDSNV